MINLVCRPKGKMDLATGPATFVRNPGTLSLPYLVVFFQGSWRAANRGNGVEDEGLTGAHVCVRQALPQ